MKWFAKYWYIKGEYYILSTKYKILEEKYKDLLRQVDTEIWEDLDEC